MKTIFQNALSTIFGSISVFYYVTHLRICFLIDSFTTLSGSFVWHVDAGSVLNISCLVVNYSLKLEYIIFYQNNKVI